MRGKGPSGSQRLSQREACLVPRGDRKKSLTCNGQRSSGQKRLLLRPKKEGGGGGKKPYKGGGLQSCEIIRATHRIVSGGTHGNNKRTQHLSLLYFPGLAGGGGQGGCRRSWSKKEKKIGHKKGKNAPKECENWGKRQYVN